MKSSALTRLLIGVILPLVVANLAIRFAWSTDLLLMLLLGANFLASLMGELVGGLSALAAAAGSLAWIAVNRGTASSQGDFGIWEMLVFLFIGAAMNFLLEVRIGRSRRVQLESDKLRATIASIADGIVVTGTDSRIVLMNSAAVRLTGWESTDWQGQLAQNVVNLVDGVTRTVPQNPVGAILKGETPDRPAEPLVLIRRDQRGVPIDHTASQIVDEQGVVLGAVMVMRDISAHRHHERALQEANASFRALIDAAPLAIMVFDLKGRITMWSPAAERMFGWSESEVLGMALPRMPGDSREYSTPRQGTPVIRYEAIRPTKDGRQLNVNFSTAALRDNDDEITGFIIIAEDVTHNKRAALFDHALQSITTALSQAVTPQNVAEIIVSRIASPLGSPACATVVLSEDGKSIELLKSHGLHADMPSRFLLDEPDPLIDSVRTTTSIWLSTKDEYQHYYPLAQDIFQEYATSHALACVPLVAGKRTLGGFGLSFSEERTFDHLERTFLEAAAQQCALALDRARLYEAEAQARRAAERADLLKLQFLAMISHELRTPLTSIKGFASSLLATDVIWNEARQREFIEIISDESDTLTDLIDQLLDFSRIESGTLRIVKEPVTILSILGDALPQLRTLTLNHLLRVNVPETLPPVDADRRRIGQVLTNLVGNAARYAPSLTEIWITAYAEGDMICVDISDEGPGIAPEDRERVFEPFRQGTGREREESKGVGLGLAISRGLIDAHQGRIWFRDPPPKVGTVVSFALPVCAPERLKGQGEPEIV